MSKQETKYKNIDLFWGEGGGTCKKYSQVVLYSTKTWITCTSTDPGQTYLTMQGLCKIGWF
jgi:hypothetical protein